ncbi:hypothetical protein CALCODRAFT_503918 [Calocera cornea HHB12733]|uniref:Telomere-associated protein Rif1 N-terminal domain-containing protein n=1 Tax=Calocera cornea HHB12733 TaxID=1353952 RepID=A0A165CP64_9BASI|nr:hypothetical protein CALCODRAFT_503918 [Calocera cornea HHB12733]
MPAPHPSLPQQSLPQPQKENIPPPPTPPTRPTTPAPRVEFAPNPLFSPPPPSAPSACSPRHPLRGILKPPKHMDFPLADQDRHKPSSSSLALGSDGPPEAPVADEDYLTAPLNVLLRSLDRPAAPAPAAPLDRPTTHDLTEAHALLLARLKHARHLLPPALEPLRTHRAAFLAALARDVARALNSPYVPCSSSEDDPGHPSSPLTPTTTTTNNTTKKPSKRGVSEHEILRARDEIALCHAAIRLSAVVLLQPGVHALMTERETGDVFAGVLALPAAPGGLPTPNPKRTNHYALWALSNTRIAPALVLPHRAKLLRVLERGVRGELGARGGAIGNSGEVVRGQAFDTLTSFLTHYPELLPTLTPLLPPVLAALLPTSSAQLRPKATQSLLAFSLALKRYRALLLSQGKSDLKDREAVEKLVMAWLKSRRAHSGPAGSSSTSAEEKPIDALERALRAALSTPTATGEQALVLPLLGSLLHLAGPQALAWSGLKAIMSVLQAALKHRPLLPAWARVWDVLVWGVAEGEARGVWPRPGVEDGRGAMPLMLGAAAPAAPAPAAQGPPPQPSRERIEKMVRQGVSALVKAGAPDQAGEVWRALVWAGVERGAARWTGVEGVVRQAGARAVLDVLRPALALEGRGAGADSEEEEEGEDVSGDDAAASEPKRKQKQAREKEKEKEKEKKEEEARSLECLLDDALFTPCTASKAQAQTQAQASAPTLAPGLDVPAWWPGLTEREWRESADAFMALFFAGLGATGPGPSPSTGTGTTAGQEENTGESADLTLTSLAPLAAADELLQLLCKQPDVRRCLFTRILLSSPKELGARAHQEWAQRALRFLRIVLASTLGPGAQKRTFGLGGFAKPGQELAKALMQCIMGDELGGWKAAAIGELLGMDGLIWNQSALEDLASWVWYSLRAKDGEEWQPLVLPVLALWLPRLERGLGLDSAGVKEVLLLSRPVPEQWRRVLAAVGNKALQYVSLGLADLPAVLACEREDTLCGPLLGVLGDVMGAAYDKAEMREGAEDVLAALLAAVLRLAASRDRDGAVAVVRRVYSSVGVWLKDEKEVLSEEAYNTFSAGIYAACLTLLSPLPAADQDTLNTLAPFLSSAFCRMPAPGVGPQAFARFWASTFHGQELDWPQELKPALRWFAKQDPSFAPGLGLEATQTQTSAGGSMPMSVLSDSEPERARDRLALTMELSASEAGSAMFASRETVRRRVSFGGTQESYDGDVSVSVVLPSVERMALTPAAAEGTSLQLANSTILLGDLTAATPPNVPSVPRPLPETQEASDIDESDVPQVSDEIISTAVVMQAFGAPRSKAVNLDESDESIITPSQSVIASTPSAVNATPSIVLQPANADGTTVLLDDTSADISVVPETQFPRAASKAKSTSRVQRIETPPTSPSSSRQLELSPTSSFDEEDEADAANIEFSLSQELDEPEEEEEDVFVPPPPPSLGKRKRTRSGSASSTRKKRKTPATPTTDAGEEEEVQHRLAMVSSPASTSSKISSPEVSIDEVEDTFIREEASKSSASQPTPSSSREMPLIPSVSQPSPSSAEPSKKRKRIFLESVEIITPPKRRRINSSDGKGKAVEPEKRVRYAGNEVQTSGLLRTTSTPAGRSNSDSQTSAEGDSQTSPGAIAAAGSQFWRGVRYAFSRVAGQTESDNSQESPSSSRKSQPTTSWWGY